jgi:hypothetical protein
MNITRFTPYILFIALIWTSGCTTSRSDSLAGWHLCFSQDPKTINRAVWNDCQDYLQKLPLGISYVQDYNNSNISLFEDGTGQHAVKIEMLLNGTYSEHVLIYDKDNRRIKVVVYSGGRHGS